SAMDPSAAELLQRALEPLASPLPELAAKTAQTWVAALADREALARAHARLFLGPFEILAPPYASLYLDPSRRLMGQFSRQAETAYAEAGLALGPGPREAPDHIAHELEFMYYLVFQEVADGHGVWADRQRRFWMSHLGRWLPDFADDVRQADCHPFYNALGWLLAAFAERESAYSNVNVPQSASD
ncbi:MAG: molecular chaperone TorD family protein, partial [Pirellulaceae bacterium]